MKKVFFIIPTLGGGGAERVMLTILRSLNRDKLKPILILFEKKGEYLDALPPDIDIKVIGTRKGIFRLWGLVSFGVIKKLSKLIKDENPDVLVSFMWFTNAVAIIAKKISKTTCKIISSERYGLKLSYEGWFTECQRKAVIRCLYPAADRIIVNAREMGEHLIDMYKIPSEKIEVIYNPVDIEKIIRQSKEECDHRWVYENVPIIMAAGRLVRQKGFEYLLKALSIILSEGQHCRLMVMGTGKEEMKLMELADQLKINENVDFLGFQKNPYKYFARSAVFVLSSLYEGFPNVLLEAMALGVPSVAACCPTGPDEIITSGVDGLLVPPADEKALADAIKRLLQNKDLRKKLGEAARKRAEYFEVGKIVRQYENTIDSVCAVYL